MRRSILLVLVLGIVSSVCLLGGAASAATIVQMQSFSNTTDFVQPLQFDRFDGSLGTLNSVEIRYEAVANGTIELQNTSGSSRFVTAGLSTQLGLADSGGLMLSAGLTLGPGTASLVPFGSGTITDLIGDAAVARTFSDVTGFLGTGPLVLDSIGTSTLFGMGLTGVDTVFFADVSGKVTISYDFDRPAGAMPEPHAALGFGAGLLAAGLARRRRR